MKTLSNEEREKLNQEWKALSEKVKKGEFASPVDVRRMEEITSLLMTDGQSSKVKFKFVKGRGGKMGLNTKGYNHKGKVGL